MTTAPREQRKVTTKTIEPGGWVWQSAYADCLARNNTLPSYIWEMLQGYQACVGLNKIYKTREEAIEALRRALDEMKKTIERYYP